jgi:hypothetical protein
VLGYELAVRVLALAERLEDVALGDDAGPGLLGVDHDGGADAAPGHRVGGVAQGVPRIHGEDHLAHSGTNLHSTSSC